LLLDLGFIWPFQDSDYFTTKTLDQLGCVIRSLVLLDLGLVPLGIFRVVLQSDAFIDLDDLLV